jgi:hypothetical protein
VHILSRERLKECAGFFKLVELIMVALVEDFFGSSELVAEPAHGFDLGILEDSRDFVVVTNERLDLVYANACADELIEQSGAYSVEEIFTDRSVPIVRETAIPAALRDGFWSGLARLRVGGQELAVSLHVTSHPILDGKLIIVHARDLSDFMRMEQTRVSLAMRSRVDA